MVRVALLSLVERTERQPDGARGELFVGGRSLIGHQLAQALALGCRRIVILVDQSIADLAPLRNAAERVGAQVHTIGSSIDLVRLVTPADELIVLADGLFASPDAVLMLLGQEQGVLCFPIDEGLAAARDAEKGQEQAGESQLDPARRHRGQVQDDQGQHRHGADGQMMCAFGQSSLRSDRGERGAEEIRTSSSRRRASGS